MNRTFLAVIAFVAFWTLALVGSYTRSIVDARREARRYNKTTTFLTQSFKYAASSKKSQRNAKTNTQNVGKLGSILRMYLRIRCQYISTYVSQFKFVGHKNKSKTSEI